MKTDFTARLRPSRRLSRIVSLSASMLLALTAVPEKVAAGARPLELAFTNMTPDEASSPVSKACVQALRQRLLEDEVTLHPLGETPLRTLVGHPDKSESFLGWTKPELMRVLPSSAPSELMTRDAVLLVDCRPEDGTLDLLLLSSAQGRATLRVRGVPLTSARVRWVGEEALSVLWHGFVP